MAALVLTGALMAGGCKGDAPTAKPDPAAKAGETAKGDPAATDETPAPAEGAKAPAGAAEGAKASAADPAEKGVPPKGKDALAKAYVEIYCAQRKKETERLLEIYTRYGFEDPKTWTASWTEAAKDDAWVAEITQKAIQTCP